MTRLLALVFAAAVTACAMTPAMAADKCIAVGEGIGGVPMDLGRIPQPHLVGLPAQKLIAELGADPEFVEMVDEVVIYWLAASNDEQAGLVERLRFVVAYAKGCAIGGKVFPVPLIDHAMPGV